MDLDRIVEEIESRLDITNVVGKYVKLKKAGRNHTGLCPFHPEKTPSFTVSPEKGFFYCFGCKAGGNIVHFVSKIEGLSYMEALKSLADEAGVQIDNVKITKKKTTEYDLMNVVSDYFINQLKVYRPAQDYLKTRGITDEISKMFKLGYSPARGSYLPKIISENEFELKMAENLGVLGVSKDGSFYGYMRDRVIFPIHDIRGRLVAFGGRILGEGNPKYLNSQATPIFDKSRTLYGINLAKRSIQNKSRVIVCEGYMDTISMHKVGFTESVSTLGTAFTDDHAKILRRFTNNIYLFFDSDKAGKNATVGAIKACLKQGLECRVISSENVKDPDDLACKGESHVLEAVEKSSEAINFVMFFFASLEKDSSSPNAKSRIARQTMEVISCSPDPIVRKNYNEEIAYFLDIPKSVISKYVKKNPKINLSSNSSKTRSRFERRIISIMCRDTVVTKEILEIATADYFKNPALKKIYEIIKGFEGDLKKFREFFQKGELEDELSSVIAGMLVDESDAEEEKLFVEQVVNDITRYSLEMYRKKHHNQDLTSEELGMYLRLQRKVRGTKRRENKKENEKNNETFGIKVDIEGHKEKSNFEYKNDKNNFVEEELQIEETDNDEGEVFFE